LLRCLWGSLFYIGVTLQRIYGGDYVLTGGPNFLILQIIGYGLDIDIFKTYMASGNADSVQSSITFPSAVISIILFVILEIWYKRKAKISILQK